MDEIHKRVSVDREAKRFRTKKMGYFHTEVGRQNQERRMRSS